MCLSAADSPQAVFERSARALASQDYAQAEVGFSQVLKSEPRNVGALGNLGVVYSRTNRFSKAVDVYTRALKLAPGNPQLLTNLALAHIRQERFDLALPVLEQISAPTAGALQLLGMCRLQAGDSKAAAIALERARNGDPSDVATLYLLGVAYTRLSRTADAIAVQDEIAAKATPEQASLFRGKALYEEGRFEEAAAEFRRAGAQRELGKTCISMRRNAEAEAALKAALVAQPNDTDAHYFLGGLYVLEERFADAAPHLESVTRSTPDAWGAYYYLAKVRLAESKPTEAAKLLERASELNNREAAVYYLLARALKQAGRAAEAQAALARVRDLKAAGLANEVDLLTGSRSGLPSR